MPAARAPRQDWEAGAATQGLQSRQQSAQGGGFRPRKARPASGAVPGQFDFYLLTLSWSPAYCETHTGAECTSHLGFVLHGLWPQDTNGTYPENCSHEPGPSDPQTFAGLYPDPGLLQHEWQTHGTCSGMSPDAYFTEAKRAVAEIHVPLGIGSLGSATPAAILQKFATANPGFPVSSFALSCGNNELTAVQVCLNKDLTAASCASVRTCGATSVRITAP